MTASPQTLASPVSAPSRRAAAAQAGAAWLLQLPLANRSQLLQPPQIQMHGKTCEMTESSLTPAIISPFGIQLTSSPLQLSSHHQLGKQADKPGQVLVSTIEIFQHIQGEPVLPHPLQLTLKCCPAGGNLRALLVTRRTCAPPAHPSQLENIYPGQAVPGKSIVPGMTRPRLTWVWQGWCHARCERAVSSAVPPF